MTPGGKLMTQLTDIWAPTPMVAPDFYWYGPGGSLFSTLAYAVNNVIYPPTTDVFYSGDRSRYQAYTTPLATVITFDAINSLALTNAVQTIIPSGATVVSYSWDFGNGQTALGPIASTTYVTAGPDVVARLTTVDSLGRSRTVFHNMNLQAAPQPGGSVRVSQGTARTS